MNLILCVLTTFSVVLSNSSWLAVQNADQMAVGEVIEIGCKKSWRKDQSNKEELLHPKRDKGRKVFIGESYRCEGKGSLKLVVYSRPVDVTEAMGPFPVGKNAGEDKPNTAGPPGEELSWLQGTYRLNAAESDDAGKGGEKFLASLTQEQKVKLNETLGAQLMSPPVFAIHPSDETVNVFFPQNHAFTFTADGVMRERQLPGGTFFQFKAAVKGLKLIVNSIGQAFTADMKVEPKDEGQQLEITRTIHISGRDKPIKWTTVYDREALESASYPPSPAFRGLTGAYGVASLGETVTTELHESISTENLTESWFSLRVTAPEHLAGAIITGRISKKGNPETGTFWLNLDFDYILLPSGATKYVRGDIKQIVSPGGAIIATELDLKQRRTSREGMTAAGQQVAAANAEPQATYSLDRTLILEKGSKIVIYLRSMQ